MTSTKPLVPEVGHSLAVALLKASQAPVLLLDDNLRVVEASDSFCRAFGIDPGAVSGQTVAELGDGEWDKPQLDSLLRATIGGGEIQAYEMDLSPPGGATRRLVIDAHLLDYSTGAAPRVLVAISDVTEARLAAKLKDDLLREKHILLQELQHRVANSLQIIASVLMQSAKKVQSDEARSHLHQAHDRVMSIATLQKHLAATRLGDVELRSYFADLCRSIGASMIDREGPLKLTSTVDDSLVKADTSISLGLIVTELVINALKHAFPGPDRPGTIAVEYRSSGFAWNLTVTDDGVGMPADHAAAKPGLGTGIVDALSKSLDATVTVSDADPGTRVAVTHEA